MTFSEQSRSLIHAPFTLPDVVHRLGRGVWLYLWLLDTVNAQGLVLRSVRSIATSLCRPEGEILDWLGRLVGLGLVEVRSPAPHLVLKLTSWSGPAPPPGTDSAESGVKSELSREVVPVSRLQASKQAANINITGDGVPGEGGHLMADLVAVLGAADTEAITSSLADIPEPIVRRALARVRATPAQQIKKSRLALFRYLITKFTHDSTYAQYP